MTERNLYFFSVWLDFLKQIAYNNRYKDIQVFEKEVMRVKTNAERRLAKAEKRKQIEREMRQIVLESNREILYDNLRRRRRREFHVGDEVTVVEWIGGGYGKDKDAERLYRVTEGTVIAAVPGGYFVEGSTQRGRVARDFINRAHIINGTVKIFPKAEA